MNQPNLPADRFLAEASLQTISLAGTKVILYVPDPAAIQEAYQKGEIAFPYWSKIWPAAIALGEYLVQHPHLIQGKKVIELGAGLGLPSLVAARVSGPVLCTDHAPEAIAFAKKSAAFNGLENLQTAIVDWNHLPPNLEAEVVLLSDINYEPVAFNALLDMVHRFREKHILTLLSTPQRLLAKDFIAPLAGLCSEQKEYVVWENGQQVLTTVMVLSG